jgi:hypothetical protein
LILAESQERILDLIGGGPSSRKTGNRMTLSSDSSPFIPSGAEEELAKARESSEKLQKASKSQPKATHYS